ncbi:lipoprotein 17-related variable surface protein [Mycoplasmopsis columbinasalis]|uniref:Lipoprotein associated domain n=1 Tax=Mycoplasmopsis columbinasalis TaxID=114880 RepID=A0A449B9I9_9BACT|nr:lipoprotein 17-related variable surface protein [Mycoplasmopsis columbinasalis]VEU77836.1 Lipoprotein associated domain [Mycoplasmopsis columbinasalis]
MKLKKFSFLLSTTAATVAVPLVAVSCGKTATTEVTAQGELDKITAVAFTGTNQANTSVNDVTNEQLKLKAGEADYKAPTGSDVKVAFDITTRLAVDGSLKVKVSVQKGAETPQTKELDLTGFKAEPAVQNVTQAEVDAEAAKITAVEYNGTEASAKENVLPSQVDAANLVAKAGEQSYVLPVGGNWAKEFVKTADDAAGTLKVKVKVTSGTLFAESKEVTLDGFLTSANKKAAEVQAEANKITAVEYLGTGESAKEKVLPSAVTFANTNFKAKVNNNDYELPTAVEGKAWSLEFVKVTADDAKGKLTVKVKVTFDDVSRESKDIVLEGFLTSDQKAVNDAKTAITSADYADKASVLPSTADVTKFSVTQAPAAGIAVSYEIVANSQNDASGTLKVKATLTKGDKTAVTGELEVSGFLTTVQDAAAKKAKADAEATRLAATNVTYSGSLTWASVDEFVAAFKNSEASGQTLREAFTFADVAEGYRAVFKADAVKKDSEQTKATLKFTVNFSGQTSEEKTVDFTVPITPTSSSS